MAVAQVDHLVHHPGRRLDAPQAAHGLLHGAEGAGVGAAPGDDHRDAADAAQEAVVLDVAVHRKGVVVGGGQLVQVAQGRRLGDDVQPALQPIVGAEAEAGDFGERAALAGQDVRQLADGQLALAAHREVHVGVGQHAFRIEGGVHATEHDVGGGQRLPRHLGHPQRLGQGRRHGGDAHQVRLLRGEATAQRLAVHHQHLHVEERHVVAAGLGVGREVGEAQGRLEGGDVEVATLDPVDVVLVAVAEFVVVEEGRVDEEDLHARPSAAGWSAFSSRSRWVRVGRSASWRAWRAAKAASFTVSAVSSQTAARPTSPSSARRRR